ncbi:hypothetical protein [Parapedobacter sp. DT-150]|uniref:hypothetical protein n=1 Tax=Parapedobacter sp. DT-150 TaxID=3396162 RepID=UPI003F1BBD5D
MLVHSPKLPAIFSSIGFFLTSVLVITFLSASFTFFIGGTLNGWLFIVAVVIALGLTYCFFSPQIAATGFQSVLIFLGAPLLVILLPLLICNYFYDVSFDGQAYHQETLIQLKEGWNPYWEYLPNSVNQAIWINHYAKAMEIIQAAIYCTFGHIEMGKATNMMLWIASFCLTFSLLCQYVSSKKGALFSFLLSCSPLVINQLITYYVDGALTSSLLILLVLCTGVAGRPTRYQWVLLSFVIILLVNIKFTGVVYVTLSLAGFMIWSLFKRLFSIFRTLLLASVLSGILALITGYNPYFTNTINYGHPFYPLMGDNKVDIMDINTPSGFNGKGGFERFFLATFAHTNNLYPWNEEDIPLKIPFTFNEKDIVNAPKVDARLGGFGPFFSGILLLAVLLFGLILFRAQRDQAKEALTWFALMVIFSIIIMPESWWARYIPQFWFIPPVLLIGSELLFSGKYRILKLVLSLSCIGNILFSLPGILINITLTEQINHQLDVFKTVGKPITVQWRASASNRIRFIERGISFKEDNLADFKSPKPDMTVEFIPGSEALFLKSSDWENLRAKKSTWLKLTEHWLPNTWKHY